MTPEALRDLYTNTVADAARFERHRTLPDTPDDRPTRGELAEEAARDRQARR